MQWKHSVKTTSIHCVCFSILRSLYYRPGMMVVGQFAQQRRNTMWAIPRYPGHLRHEVLIFWQKSLRTIHTYHLVPFNLPKNVQGGPFQGLLVFKHFFPKIPNFTKYALTPSLFGRSSSVIPFRKALAIPVAGPYWSLSW